MARYRRSEKGRETWRRQTERRRQIRAQRRAELALVSGPLKRCRKGLHIYDPEKSQGGTECRRETRARYRQSAKGGATITAYRLSERGRAVFTRYRQSEKGRAMTARYRQDRKLRNGSPGTT